MANPLVGEQRLAWLAETIARLYLEAERGLRSPDQLRRFMTLPVYVAHRKAGMASFSQGGPVLQEDLGQVRVSMLGERRAFAAIPTREEQQRWGALMLQLEADQQDRWRVVELLRLPHRLLERDAPAPTPQDPVQALRYTAEERRLVERTRQQLAERRAVAPPQERSRLERQLHTWEQRAGDLDREAAALAARLRARDELGEGLSEQTLQQPPAYLTRLIGALPSHGSRREAWLAAAGHVEGYRDRWAVQDQDTALGELRHDAVQHHDRQTTCNRLRELTRELDHRPAAERALELEREEANALEL